ncbi:Conserved_hypothetical protein [Hexamita inflata]|uniref:Uncharacterized protein n=2 Tax=Hexamita inflata TaxID=28002 RepID=A0AA86VRI0_9EUKA|nr:Conserved hypothetical protein [Hexamita inflata]
MYSSQVNQTENEVRAYLLEKIQGTFRNSDEFDQDFKVLMKKFKSIQPLIIHCALMNDIQVDPKLLQVLADNVGDYDAELTRSLFKALAEQSFPVIQTNQACKQFIALLDSFEDALFAPKTTLQKMQSVINLLRYSIEFLISNSDQLNTQELQQLINDSLQYDFAHSPDRTLLVSQEINKNLSFNHSFVQPGVAAVCVLMHISSTKQFQTVQKLIQKEELSAQIVKLQICLKLPLEQSFKNALNKDFGAEVIPEVIRAEPGILRTASCVDFNKLLKTDFQINSELLGIIYSNANEAAKSMIRVYFENLVVNAEESKREAVLAFAIYNDADLGSGAFVDRLQDTSKKIRELALEYCIKFQYLQEAADKIIDLHDENVFLSKITAEQFRQLVTCQGFQTLLQRRFRAEKLAQTWARKTEQFQEELHGKLEQELDNSANQIYFSNPDREELLKIRVIPAEFIVNLDEFESNVDYFYALCQFVALDHQQLIALSQRLLEMNVQQQIVAIFVLNQQMKFKPFQINQNILLTAMLQLENNKELNEMSLFDKFYLFRPDNQLEAYTLIIELIKAVPYSCKDLSLSVSESPVVQLLNEMLTSSANEVAFNKITGNKQCASFSIAKFQAAASSLPSVQNLVGLVEKIVKSFHVEQELQVPCMILYNLSMSDESLDSFKVFQKLIVNNLQMNQKFTDETHLQQKAVILYYILQLLRSKLQGALSNEILFSFLNELVQGALAKGSHTKLCVEVIAALKQLIYEVKISYKIIPLLSVYMSVSKTNFSEEIQFHLEQLSIMKMKASTNTNTKFDTAYTVYYLAFYLTHLALKQVESAVLEQAVWDYLKVVKPNVQMRQIVGLIHRQKLAETQSVDAKVKQILNTCIGQQVGDKVQFPQGIFV